MVYLKFASRLRMLRTTHDPYLTQTELASALKKIGCSKISKSSINMYERGEREPGFDTLEAIADFFNVDMNYLLGWPGDGYDYDSDPDNLASVIYPQTLEKLNGITGHKFKETWTIWQVLRTAANAEDAVSRLPQYERDLVIELFNFNWDEEVEHISLYSDEPDDDTDPVLNELSNNAEQLNAQGLQKLVDISDDMVTSGKYQKTALNQAASVENPEKK